MIVIGTAASTVVGGGGYPMIDSVRMVTAAARFDALVNISIFDDVENV